MRKDKKQEYGGAPLYHLGKNPGRKGRIQKNHPIKNGGNITKKFKKSNRSERCHSPILKEFWWNTPSVRSEKGKYKGRILKGEVSMDQWVSVLSGGRLRRNGFLVNCWV